MGQLAGIWAGVREFWMRLSKQLKILIGAGVVVAFAAAVAVTMLLNAPQDYVTLYDKLDPAEASEIVKVLTDLGVDARLEKGALTIPADQENAMRLQLAGMGYPKSSFSYPQLTENIGLFSTESEKRMWEKIQTQERLINTLQLIDGVQKAVVTLDIPEQKDYVLNKNQKPPTASVTLSLAPNYVLTQQQVMGMEYLIMKSVSGLTAENIAIVDNLGRHVNGQKEEEVIDESVIEKKRLEYKRELEGAARDEVLNLLKGIYGSGVTASVAATLDYNKFIQEEVKYDPSVGDKGMVAHEDKTQITGSASTAEGTVGSDPNADIPTYPTEQGGNGQNYSENTESTSYLVNSLKTQSQKDGYELTKLTVSVAVNNPDLTDAERTELVRAVAMAAGTDEASVSVIGREFIPAAETPGATGGQNVITTQMIVFGSVGLGVVLLIVGALVLALVMSSRRRKRELAAMEEERLIHEREEQKRIQELLAAQAAAGGGSYDDDDEDEEDPEEYIPTIHDKLIEFTVQNPEIAASLLKMWIRT